MRKAVILTRKEENELFAIIVKNRTNGANKAERRHAREAESLMINLNQFLIAAVVCHYPTRTRSFQVLMEVGNRGLIEALKHYDLHKLVKFSTYATWWIRKEIHTELGLPV